MSTGYIAPAPLTEYEQLYNRYSDAWREVERYREQGNAAKYWPAARRLVILRNQVFAAQALTNREYESTIEANLAAHIETVIACESEDAKLIVRLFVALGWVNYMSTTDSTANVASNLLEPGLLRRAILGAPGILSLPEAV